MPAAVLIPLIAAGASAGASIAAAKMQSGANKDAAKLQTASADKAAALQAQGGADVLAFQKSQAALDRGDAETNRRANYDQWASREGRIGQFGDLLGLPSRQIPGYVPLNAPQTTAGSMTGQTPNTGNPQQIISAWQATHSPSEGMGGLIGALKSAGVQASPYLYGQTPSANEISLNGEKYKVIAGEHTGNPSWYVAGTPDGPPGGSGMAPGPYQTTMGNLMAPSTPALRAPVVQPYMPQPWTGR